MPPFAKTAVDFVAYLVIRVFICIVQATSIEACQYFAHALGWLAADVLKLRRKTVDENLRHVFPQQTEPQRRKMKRRMWEHLFLMVCEIAHAPRKLHDTNWRRYIQLRNERPMLLQLLDERPTILVSGHYGNFEIAGFVTGLLGFSTHTVARQLDNPFLDRFLNKFRAINGQFMLPKDGSAPLIGAVLDQGGTLGLLGDQHAGEKGCWVEFLGRLASCHKAVAVFTIAGKAPMVVAYARRLERPLHFEVGMQGLADPMLNGPECGGVKPLTEWYNQRLAEVILAAPEQYWWMHRRWRDPPAKVKRKLAA
jgi:Kdo2-lipid IVA lauroyltransferase/acyltransferase